jgi:cytochrome P450
VTEVSKCPEDYVFASDEVNACPYPFYAAVRPQSPAYHVPSVNGVLVTRYEDVLGAAKQPAMFSNHRPLLGAGDPEFAAIHATGFPVVAGLVTNDPPEHTRFRKLVNRPFTNAAVSRHEPVIRETVSSLIDAFIQDGECELLTQFAMPFPTRVIGQVLGVPVEDQASFGRWSDDVAESVSGYISRERALECARSLVDMQHYFAGLIEKRRVEPGDDLISSLVTAREDDERPLDVPEMLELIRVFLVGGTESTASLLGSTFYLLLTHPDELAQVRTDHSLIPQMLEEVLRLESPVQWNPRLVESEGVHIEDVAIEPGSRVILSWGAANRDPAKFGDNADEFDIHRPQNTHAAFGHAFHFCLGAPLARLEARIACEQLLTRLDKLELAVPVGELTFVGHGVVRRIERLPLRFKPSAG